MSQEPLVSIVDDDAGVRSSLDGLVRSLGYRVALFDSAEAFLSSEARDGSHCVVSDVQMPGGMSGIDLLRRMHDAHCAVPVILISAFTTDALREQALAAGAYCTLKKPFDGEDLVTCIERALAA